MSQIKCMNIWKEFEGYFYNSRM